MGYEYIIIKANKNNVIYIDIQCYNILAPANGEISSCSSGKVGVGYEGDTCSFTCDTGYELPGDDTRTCQSNGSWSGSDDVYTESYSGVDDVSSGIWKSSDGMYKCRRGKFITL